MQKMELVNEYGREGIATVYIARNRCNDKHMLEFAESVQRPLPIKKKWVLIISTMYGCPVGCSMCDGGSFYYGKLTAKEMFEQIDYMVKKRFPDKKVKCEKFKIQFARLGEPAFNLEVLHVLRHLPDRYDAPGLIPSISSVAPANSEVFFEELFKIKNELYNKGNFQLQFSIHTTDTKIRDRVIPIKKWSFEEISSYGERFFRDGDRKITLNFAAIEGAPVEPSIIKDNFNPDKFILKFTPLNPTEKVKMHKLQSLINVDKLNNTDKLDINDLFKELNSYGFETILSIGDLEENNIGSNCGQILSINRNKCTGLRAKSQL